MARSAGSKRVVCLLVAAGFLGTACTGATAPQSGPAVTPCARPDAPGQKDLTPAAPSPLGKGDQSAEVPVRLTAEHISPVVAAATPRVKTRCWQVALDKRGPDAPMTARVLVEAEIEPSGSIASAHTDDAPAGYPELADCVLSVVRTLTFHPASESTIVTIPFVFDAR
ncbi:MAG: AgmX/PglI C-terminal domain-containing protein [Myxococcales bacterium]